MPGAVAVIVRRYRPLVYAILALVFLTGAAHFGLHHYLRREGAFGPEPHPAEPWALKLHGAAAMATLVLLGSLLGPHVQRFWRLRRNRFAGALLVGLTGWLVASGYALYYVGAEQAREVARIGHIAMGFLVVPIFVAHLLRGRHVVRRRRSPPTG